MSAFGRKFGKRGLGSLEARALSDHDCLMLMAGKQFLGSAADVFEMADDQVLVVVDVRDPLGALWACIQIGMLDDVADGDDVRAQHIIDEFKDDLTNHAGEPNRHPFVAFWAERCAGLLEWLRANGFGVPTDWDPAFASPPHAGNVWTMLKRANAGLLMSIDYSQIPSLSVAKVSFSGAERRRRRAASRRSSRGAR